jgi:carbamate kinase
MMSQLPNLWYFGRAAEMDKDPVVTAVGRLKQEDSESQASLGYMVRRSLKNKQNKTEVDKTAPSAV